MKTVAYEAVFIIDASQPDEQVKAIIEKYSHVITAQGGEVTDVDRWDPRRLAYEVKKKREGIFIVVNFLGTAEVHDELHRIFRISDDILRSIIVRQNPKADHYPSKARAAEVERREREAAARAAAIPAPVVVAEPAAAEPITELSAPTAENGVSEEDRAAADAADAVDADETTSATESSDAE